MSSAKEQERFAAAWDLMQSEGTSKTKALDKAFGYQPNQKSRKAFDAFLGRDAATDGSEPPADKPEPVSREKDAPPASTTVSTVPSADLTKGLTSLIAETGTLMAVVSPVTGITTVNQAPATAAALNKIAAKNPLVHAALEKLVAGSGYYELIIAVYPIAVAFAYEWALPEDSGLMPRAHNTLRKRVPELVSEGIIPPEYVLPQHLPSTGDGEPEPAGRVGLLDGLDATG